MASESNFLSQTLQSITTTKMREQNRRSKLFEASKSKVFESVAAAADDRARLEVLLSAFKELSTSNKGISYVDQDRKDTTQNTARYLEQSYRDPSVSTTIIQSFERNLEKKLEQESQRFEFANLYYRLLGEWTGANSDPMERSEQKEDELDGSFEHVQKYDLQKLKDKFASVVFTPLHTDEVEIDNYLSALFEDDHAESLLEDIRQANVKFGETFKVSGICTKCMHASRRLGVPCIPSSHRVTETYTDLVPIHS